jgi:hypothetical protein
LLKNWKIDIPEGTEDNIWISIFSYQKDFSPLIDQIGENKNITILLSPGESVKEFLAYRKEKGNLFSCVELPFLAQSEWDKLLFACDINLVRGEESLSRAALSGRPFLWQAYPLEDQEHLNKVDAFCEILCRNRSDLKELFFLYNKKIKKTDRTHKRRSW